MTEPVELRVSGDSYVGATLSPTVGIGGGLGGRLGLDVNILPGSGTVGVLVEDFEVVFHRHAAHPDLDGARMGFNRFAAETAHH